MAHTWRTRLTQKFPCSIPIMSAPMAGVSGGDLAASTCLAGGLGFIAAGHLSSPQCLDREILKFKKKAPPGSSLALGFIGHSCFKDGPARVEAVLDKYKPQVVQFSFPAVVVLDDDKGRTNVDLAHDHGCLVMAQVGTVAEAKVSMQAGVDCLIAQGSEAGGHGVRRELGNGTLAFSAHLVSLAQACPQRPAVLAAGGIVDGRGLAAALALGCDGAVLGTRLWASKEAMGRDIFKERLASPDSGPDQVTRTTVPDLINNTHSRTPWPYPYDSSGVLRNELTDKWDGRDDDLADALKDERGVIVEEYRNAEKEGDYNIAAVHSGEGVGEIHSVDNTLDIITRINDEAIFIINTLPLLIGKS